MRIQSSMRIQRSSEVALTTQKWVQAALSSVLCWAISPCCFVVPIAWQFTSHHNPSCAVSRFHADRVASQRGDRHFICRASDKGCLLLSLESGGWHRRPGSKGAGETPQFANLFSTVLPRSPLPPTVNKSLALARFDPCIVNIECAVAGTQQAAHGVRMLFFARQGPHTDCVGPRHIYRQQRGHKARCTELGCHPSASSTCSVDASLGCDIPTPPSSVLALDNKNRAMQHPSSPSM